MFMFNNFMLDKQLHPEYNFYRKQIGHKTDGLPKC